MPKSCLKMDDFNIRFSKIYRPNQNFKCPKSIVIGLSTKYACMWASQWPR